MIATSPGPNSISVPSSIRMRWRPETKILTWRRWQLSPPTVGLTCDDHRQPGSRVSRAKVKPPIVTESIFAFSGVLVSSGESKLFPSSRGISISFLGRRASERPPTAGFGLRSAVLRVVAGAVPVDNHRRLVADHPAVVAARQRGDLARAGDELGAVVHADRELAAQLARRSSPASVEPSSRLPSIPRQTARFEREPGYPLGCVRPSTRCAGSR